MGLSSLWSTLKPSPKPKLFLIGTADDFTGVKKFKVSIECLILPPFVKSSQDRMSELGEPNDFKVLDNVDHWWHDSELQACEAIKEWLLATY